MIISCKCPGRVRKKFYAVVAGRGNTAAAATIDLNVKVAKKEQQFQDDIDRWIKSVRCLGGGCVKHAVSGTGSTIPPPPFDAGNEFVVASAVSGLATVYCRPRVVRKKKG
jgi:hypothetical protein